MSGPPKNIEPSALFARLMARERPSLIVPYPAKGPDGEPVGQIALVPLVEAEVMACRSAAEAYASMMLDKPEDKGGKVPRDSTGYRDVYVNELYVECLARACRDPVARDGALVASNVPTFPSPQHMRQWIFPGEISVLFEKYATWQSENGPIVSQMSEPELDAWIKVLSEGASRVPLAALSSAGQRDLILHLVSRLQNSKTDTSSVGSPPEQPPTLPSGDEAPPDPVADPST